MIIKMTHSIELIDSCDEFAHLMSDDTGQVDERTLWNTHTIVSGGVHVSKRIECN